MSAITKDDVLAYKAGLVTDPAEKKAIERAAECDPLVRRWFALLTEGEPEDVFRTQADELADRWMRETIVVPRPTAVFEYVAQIEWGAARCDPAGSGPAPDDEPNTTDAYEIDKKARVARFTYPAAVVPFAVARITAEIDGKRGESILATFREWGTGDAVTRQAEVRLSDLGISLKEDSEPHLHVTVATEETLAEFDIAEVRRLRDKCNGDSKLRAAVELLLTRLQEGA